MMSRWTLGVAAIVLGSLLITNQVPAQSRTLSDTECQQLRQQLDEHARLSAGVRRSLAAAVVAAPPASAAPTTPAAGQSRAETIRLRLGQIPAEREQLQDQRLAAMVKLDFSRVSEIQGKIAALDQEKGQLEQELAGLPASTAPAPSAPPAAPSTSGAARIPCKDVATAYETAVKIRQKELGAREGQPGVVPLVALKGESSDQIARELAAQLARPSDGGARLGLLDQDGDGRLDAFVDVPADGVFRMYRQRSDGTVGVDAFVVSGAVSGRYGEVTRRLEEGIARGSSWSLVDFLAMRPAGPVRTVGETAEFGKAEAALLAGTFSEAGRLDRAEGRSREFQNFRGEPVRTLEIIMPGSGGVGLRGLTVLPSANNQELWEEVITEVRSVSYWRADVEAVVSRETRTAAGALVGTRSTPAPIRFTVER